MTQIHQLKSAIFLLIMLVSVQYLSCLTTMTNNNLEATKSINGTLDEMLRIVNGEKDKTRNWDAWRDLFLPSARFTVINNETSFETATIEEMVTYMQDDYYDNGYTEIKLSRQIDSFNGTAQVFEVVKLTEPDGNTVRGVNSYHLVFSKDRWYISNIIWTFETENHPIPENYIKN